MLVLVLLDELNSEPLEKLMMFEPQDGSCSNISLTLSALHSLPMPRSRVIYILRMEKAVEGYKLR